MVGIDSVAQPKTPGQKRRSDEHRVAMKSRESINPAADIGGQKKDVHPYYFAFDLYRTVVEDSFQSVEHVSACLQSACVSTTKLGQTEA
jgi:hypothetical protein